MMLLARQWAGGPALMLAGTCLLVPAQHEGLPLPGKGEFLRGASRRCAGPARRGALPAHLAGPLGAPSGGRPGPAAGRHPPPVAGARGAAVQLPQVQAQAHCGPEQGAQPPPLGLGMLCLPSYATICAWPASGLRLSMSGPVICVLKANSEVQTPCLRRTVIPCSLHDHRQCSRACRPWWMCWIATCPPTEWA